LVKILRFQNPKTSVKGFIYFLGVAVTSSLVKGGTELVSLALLEEANPKESSLAG
jgi:amino acid permease